MGLTNAVRDALATAIFTGTLNVTTFNAANSYLGVGDSATGYVNTQTDLQAATNKLRKVMDPGYPTQVANVLTFRATYNLAEANWAWQEWGVFDASAAGTMLNRKAESLGTKPSTQSWQITATLTLVAA